MSPLSIRCAVDASDIDKYDHLNNAAFPRYFERGRDDLAVKTGLDADTLKQQGQAFLVKRASYEYVMPVTLNQQVEIKSQIASTDGARVVIQQEMFSDGQMAAKCNIEYFFLDIKRNKPTKPPTFLL